jgi:hypothetical protein
VEGYSSLALPPAFYEEEPGRGQQVTSASVFLLLHRSGALSSTLSIDHCCGYRFRKQKSTGAELLQSHRERVFLCIELRELSECYGIVAHNSPHSMQLVGLCNSPVLVYRAASKSR